MRTRLQWTALACAAVTLVLAGSGAPVRAQQPPRAARVFAAVSSQDPAAFRTNMAFGMLVLDSLAGTVPYHVTAPVTLTVTLAPGERAVLSGAPDGRASWSVDSFLLLEVVTPASAWPDRYFAGPAGNGLESGITPVPRIGQPSPIQAPLDITALLGNGRTATITFAALDYAAAGGVSDLFLVTIPAQAAPPPAAPARVDAAPAGWHLGLWDARIAIANQPVQTTQFIFGADCALAIRADGRFERFNSGPSIEGGILTGEVLGFATPTLWREEISMTIAPDGGTAAGTFTNGGWREESGPMTWTRVVPRVDLISTVTQTSDRMLLEFRGDKLPFAGPGVLTACGDIAFEEAGMSVIRATAAGNSDGTLVRVDVALEPNVAPGMKTLRLNGVRYRWNYRGPVALTTLRFVEGPGRSAFAVDDLLNGVPFFVEAEYSGVPTGETRAARIAWDGATARDVPLVRAPDDAKVYRSRPFLIPITPPAPLPADAPAPVELRLLGEETVTATFEDKKAVAYVQPFPEVVGLAFRDHLGNILQERIENGTLRPPQIAAGELFAGLIEYEAGPNHDQQPVKMALDGAAQSMNAGRTRTDPFVFETPLRRVLKPGQTVTLYASGRAADLAIVEPRIELFVRRGPIGPRANVPSLTTEEPFHVDVFAPAEMARSIGDTLLVNFRTKDKGATASLRLRAHPSERGPRVYTHDDAVSLDLGGQGEGRSTLTWMVEGVIPNSLYNPFAGGVDMRKLKSEKVDTLVVTYGGATAEIPVYWSWRQRMLAEIAAAIDALRRVYSAGLVNPGVTRQGKEQLQKRLNLIKNYDQVMAYEGPDFDDIRRLVAARGYFDMLQLEPSSWDSDLIPTDLTGTRSLRFGVLIGSRVEGDMLQRLSEEGDREYFNRFAGAMRDATIGMYQVITNSTGANQLLVVATGTDAMGRRVTTTERWLAGIDLVSQAAMMGAATLKSAQIAREGAGGLDRARAVTAARKEMTDNVARDLILNGRTARVARPPALPADFRDRPTEAITETGANPAPRPAAPDADPIPARPGAPDAATSPTVPELTDADVRALRSEYIRSRVERLGVNREDLGVNADIQSTRDVSATDGAIVLAERYKVPASRVMSELGVDATDVARALDDSYRAGGLANAVRRSQLVAEYLGAGVPPNLDAIVSRPTPVRPVASGPYAPRPAATPGTPTVITDRVIPAPAAPRPRVSSPDGDTGAAPPANGIFSVRPGAEAPPASVKRTVVRTPVSDAAPDFTQKNQTWRAPDNRTFELSPVGKGVNADVYDINNGPNRGRVAKVYDNARTDVKRVALDEHYRETPVRSTAREVVEDIAHGAELLEANRISHLKVHEAVLDNSRPYIIQERLRPTDRIVADIESLNPAQQRAIVTLHDELANAGLILEDGHHGNLYLRDLGGGRWEAGVLDTDRIARWGQVPSQRLASHLERPIVLYGDARLGSLKGTGWGWEPANAREYMTKMFEHKGWITYDGRTGRFRPGRLDPAIVREQFDLNVGPARPAPVPARRGARAEPSEQYAHLKAA